MKCYVTTSAAKSKYFCYEANYLGCKAKTTCVKTIYSRTDHSRKVICKDQSWSIAPHFYFLVWQYNWFLGFYFISDFVILQVASAFATIEITSTAVQIHLTILDWKLKLSPQAQTEAAYAQVLQLARLDLRLDFQISPFANWNHYLFLDRSSLVPTSKAVKSWDNWTQPSSASQ